jgi:MFS family permease
MHGEHWLLISLAIFGVGSLVAAVAGSLTVMIAGRAIQGAGGAIFPLAIGIIRDEFPRERVAPAIGTVSAMFGIGGGAGLVLAGIFVDHGSISWIFWLSVATTALAALATWLWVPESPVRVRARIDWVGGALLSYAAGPPVAHQRGEHLGLDLGPRARALRGRRGLRGPVGAVGAAGRRPARRPGPHAPAPGVGDQRRRLRDRLRHVRLVRAGAPVRPDAGPRGLRVRRLGHESGLFLLPSAC